MHRHISIVSLVVLAGLFSPVPPVQGQALVPHVLQLDPEQLEQRGLLLAQEAAQLAQFQQYELALSRAQLASQLAPSTPQVWLLLGRLQLQMENFEASLNALETARQLDPEDPAALFDLGTAHFRLEDYDQSIEFIRAGLDISPAVPGAWFDLGNAYYKLNRYQDAIEAYEEAVDLQEDFWPAVNNIGLVLYEMGDIDAAVEKWQEAVEITDNQEPEPRLAIAVALFAQGEQEEAIAEGEAALQLDDRYGDVEFLRQNLWGDRLLSETQTFLQLRPIQEMLVQLGTSPDE
ncbi:MAG: tetratricopeptide repeat protein [Synechococcales bacterium]|nr:tetratricopeptide repeat protein [Synechococcales bacterium]